MRRALALVFIAGAVACARHVVVKPEEVAGRSSPSWTIVSEPQRVAEHRKGDESGPALPSVAAPPPPAEEGQEGESSADTRDSLDQSPASVEPEAR